LEDEATANLLSAQRSTLLHRLEAAAEASTATKSPTTSTNGVATKTVAVAVSAVRWWGAGSAEAAAVPAAGAPAIRPVDEEQQFYAQLVSIAAEIGAAET
jgi:hypothetical protein